MEVFKEQTYLKKNFTKTRSSMILLNEDHEYFYTFSMSFIIFL